jgi:hypothetical protein
MIILANSPEWDRSYTCCQEFTIFDLKGNKLVKTGRLSGGAQELLAIDDDNYIYVHDGITNVDIYSLQGEYIWSIDTPGNIGGTKHFYVQKKDRLLFVCDTENHRYLRMYIYDLDSGEYLQCMKIPGISGFGFKTFVVTITHIYIQAYEILYVYKRISS